MKTLIIKIPSNYELRKQIRGFAIPPKQLHKSKVAYRRKQKHQKEISHE